MLLSTTPPLLESYSEMVQDILSLQELGCLKNIPF
jgi:hypothetical protein